MTTLRTALRPPGPRALIALGLGAALTASMLGTAGASSHREAPLIAQDPVADNTDLYAFVAPDRSSHVTLISNFQGFQEPGGGPNYFKFGDDVRYNIHVDNNGDALADVSYEFRFTTQLTDGGADTYLYATAPITDINANDQWTMPQEYTVTRVAGGERTLIASGLRTAPANVGPRTTPDYPSLVQQATHDIAGTRSVFAGQRGEGFYADIASIFDLGGLRPLNSAHAIPPNTDEPGRNSFAGYNVQSIALQVPKADLTSGDDPVIGIWSTTERRKVRVFAQNSSAAPVDRGRWVQVSRLGNPLVNEVVVPLKAKDAFNSIPPVADLDVFPTLSAPGQGSDEGDIPLVTDPILANQITALYGVETPPPPRNDLVSIFLTGIDGVNQPAGDVRPAEVLRLNTSIAPTAFADQDRLGLLAGQNDGFPNGRRVVDDVIDIGLRAVAGGTPFTPDFNKAPNNALTDGVDGPDRAFLTTFPYLPTPYQGYDGNNEARF